MKRNEKSKTVAMKVMSHEVLKINGILSFIRTSSVSCNPADDTIFVSVNTLQLIDEVPVKHYYGVIMDEDAVECVSKLEKLAFLSDLIESQWKTLEKNNIAGEGEK